MATYINGVLQTGNSAPAMAPIQGNTDIVQGTSPNLQPTVDASVNTGNYSIAAPDPAAVAAANAAAANAARIAGVRSSAGQTQGSYETGARTQLGDVGNTYDDRTRSFLTGYQTGEDTLNNNRVNNQLNLRRSMAAIASGVRNGLRSGGVTLANMNALDSGAAEAMARAYATVGNEQSGDANNQAMQKNSELDLQQTTLDRQKDDTIHSLDQYRTTEVNRVSNDLIDKLRLLDSNAASQGATGAVDLGVRDRVINEAIARLNAIDADRQSRLGGIHGLSGDEILQRAVAADQAGQASSQPFAIDGPQVLQPGGAGPSLSQLPIFTRRRDTATPLALTA